jgi:hypothetical protein
MLLNGRFKLKRDYYAGGLMLLLGVGAAVTGSGYKIGSLAKMGPGFMPVVLGVVVRAKVFRKPPESGRCLIQLALRFCAKTDIARISVRQRRVSPSETLELHALPRMLGGPPGSRSRQ